MTRVDKHSFHCIVPWCFKATCFVHALLDFRVGTKG